MRVISTIAVISIHANYIFFEKTSTNPAFTFDYVSESLINIITRFSVPCFVMMSGAFNLRARNVNKSEFYKKVMWKVGFPAIGIITIFLPLAIFKNILSGDKWYLPVLSVLEGAFKIWFVFMLFGLYLLTPLIIKIKAMLNDKDIKTIILIMCIWAIVSQATSSYKISYSIGVVGSFLAYYLLGDYLLNKITVKYHHNTLILVSLLMIFITFMARYFGLQYYLSDAYINFFSPTIFLYSVCVFLIAKETRINTYWYKTSKYTFYIYLFHMFILSGINKMCMKYLFSAPLIVVLIETILTFLCSFILAFFYDEFWRRRTNWKNRFFAHTFLFEKVYK